MHDVRINEVVTDLEITEGVGALSPEEVRKLVTLVLEQVHLEQDRAEQRKKDTKITDRAYHPDVR
jgi:hypothetical protein